MSVATSGITCMFRLQDISSPPLALPVLFSLFAAVSEQILCSQGAGITKLVDVDQVSQAPRMSAFSRCSGEERLERPWRFQNEIVIDDLCCRFLKPWRLGPSFPCLGSAPTFSRTNPRCSGCHQ